METKDLGKTKKIAGIVSIVLAIVLIAGIVVSVSTKAKLLTLVLASTSFILSMTTVLWLRTLLLQSLWAAKPNRTKNMDILLRTLPNSKW